MEDLNPSPDIVLRGHKESINSLKFIQNNILASGFLFLSFFLSSFSCSYSLFCCYSSLSSNFSNFFFFLTSFSSYFIYLFQCCNVTATESCSLNNMPQDQSTLVLPGGNTRCIYSTSTPFGILYFFLFYLFNSSLWLILILFILLIFTAFQVVPGSSDNVLLYFQGGGACWDEASTKAGFCTSDSSPQSLVGIFDRNEPLNKYKDYTIVHVSYCSGDLFGGDVVRDYTDSAGVPVVQKGFLFFIYTYIPIYLFFNIIIFNLI